MAALQKPPYVFMNGKITPWDEATIHVGTEALIRGISVFEGIKGYWRHDNSSFGLLALREHYDRLCRSALLAYLPFDMSYEQFREACSQIARKLLVTPDRDLWMRTTLCSVEGHWGEGTKSDLIITAYLQDKKKPEPLDIGVSTWRRPNDTALPARVKSAANYQIGRMARIEGKRYGFHDMILLNAYDRVAEASASSMLLVRDGRVASPPPYEGCLESITVKLVEGLCKALDIPFDWRPIERTELMIADEACLLGTLTEVGRVRSIDRHPLPKSTPLLDRISDEYWACVRGERSLPCVALTQV